MRGVPEGRGVLLGAGDQYWHKWSVRDRSVSSQPATILAQFILTADFTDERRYQTNNQPEAYFPLLPLSATSAQSAVKDLPCLNQTISPQRTPRSQRFKSGVGKGSLVLWRASAAAPAELWRDKTARPVVVLQLRRPVRWRLGEGGSWQSEGGSAPGRHPSLIRTPTRGDAEKPASWPAGWNIV